MSTLNIYADMISEPSRTVIAYCNLSKIPYEFHSVDLMKSEFLSEEFTKINDLQEVPAIVHGSFSLNQSGAIIPYLADAYDIDNQWYPKDPVLRAKINAFVHWHHKGIREIKDFYLMPKVVLPLLIGSAPPSPEEEVKLREGVLGMLETFEWVLSETGYAARTAGLTIADVFAYSELSNLKLLNIDLGGYARIARWNEELEKIPEIFETGEKLRGMLQSAPASN